MLPCHSHPVQDIALSPECFPIPFPGHVLPFPTSNKSKQWLSFYHHRLILSVLKLHVNGPIHYVFFCLPFKTQHVFEIYPYCSCISNGFLFLTEQYPIALMYHRFFISYSLKTIGLFLIWGYDEQSSYKHSYTRLFVDTRIPLFWINYEA